MRRIAALTSKSAHHRARLPSLAIAGCASKKTAEQRRPTSASAPAPRRPARRRTSPSMSATASSSTPIPRRSAPTRRQTLSTQAQWLNQYGNYAITVEGHADERGTREYNLALGARRAAATRDFLVAKGVAAKRLKTISYGKERPVAVCDDISCW